MSRPIVIIVVISLFLHISLSQIIEVVQVPASRNPGSPYRYNRNIPAVSPTNSEENQVIFEFLKPKGLGIFIPGPYPPSNQYKLQFHLNINQEFEGWKRGQYNEGYIARQGAKWKYTFPNIELKQGDVIYYWIEAEGDDWEKGYKGKYEVTQSSLHGSLITETPGRCERKSVTTYSGGRQACVGEKLVNSYSYVNEKYLQGNSGIFMKIIRQIGGFEPEERFTVFSRENVLMNRTHSAFIPVAFEQKYGNLSVNAKNFTINGCTSPHPQLCTASAEFYLILPPAIAARHSSEQTFSFRYGVVEVTAKLPLGDWLVPELWLLPKDRPYNSSDEATAKIVLALSRGNAVLEDGQQDWGNHLLEAGVHRKAGDIIFRKHNSQSWSNSYHKFKLVWSPENMQFYVDNEEIGTIQKGENGLDPSSAPFDQEFYLMFGIHVGGNKDFPDNLIGKPWKNFEPKDKLKFWQARDQWQATWGVHSALYIRDLKVTAL